MIRAISPQHELLLLVLGLTFGWLGAFSLAWQQYNPLALIAMLTLSGCAACAHLWLNRVATQREIALLPVVVMLLAFGLLTITRVAPNFLPRQLGALVIATGALLTVASSADQLRWLRRFKYTWLIGAFILLAATLFLGVNPTGFGARLWLSIGGAFVQPSEILRLLVIAFLAAYFAERLEIGEKRLSGRNWGSGKSPISNLQSLLPTIAMWLVAVLLLATQQDLGAATLLLLTFGLMLFVATGSARLPLFLGGALLVAGGIGYFTSDRVAQRLNIWLNPWADPQGASFQVVQSLIAIASGGVFGQGINQGRPDFVPAVHTDFPFVVVAEEFGLIGVIALIACYAVLCLQGWRIAQRAGTSYRALLAGGLAASLALQVFVIIGGNLSLLPLTGVTLPFVSYGGTSLVVCSIMVGLLVRISNDVHTFDTSGSHLHEQRRTGRALRIASLLTTALFATLAVATGLWSAWQSASATSRDDNPRRVVAERAIARGSIYDRTGVLLAESRVQSTSNRVPTYQRRYLSPEAAPVVGYYSERYGVGGMEAVVDAGLRGTRTSWEELIHAPHIGMPVTLTLHAGLQTKIERALQSSTPATVTRGAVVVLDISNGHVLALASAPSFNPNTLDDQWDALRNDPFAPLVNRATQGLYQPGDLLQWMIDNVKIRDAKRPAHAWSMALSALNLDEPVPFELQNQAVPLPASVTVSETLGQGSLRVTPLRIAVSTAQLVAGSPITPTLLLSNTAQTATSIHPQQLEPVTTFAPISANAVVGWRIIVVGTRIIVVAIEMPVPNVEPIEQVSRAAGEQ